MVCVELLLGCETFESFFDPHLVYCEQVFAVVAYVCHGLVGGRIHGTAVICIASSRISASSPGTVSMSTTIRASYQKEIAAKARHRGVRIRCVLTEI
jgi:hypothetical protein